MDYLKKIIGFYGTVGGVGTTSIVNQLAYSFAQKGNKVLVLENNLLYPHNYTYFKGNTLPSFVNNLKDSKKFSESLFNIQGVDYIYQEPMPLIEYVQIAENNKNYIYIKKLFLELRKIYDLIFIDLNINYLNDFITVGYLKHIDLFVEIKNDTNISLNNSNLIKTSISLLNNFINKKISIYNKLDYTINKELYLPYEKDFILSYNKNELFIVHGSSYNTNYSEQFNNIFEVIDKNLQGEV